MNRPSKELSPNDAKVVSTSSFSAELERQAMLQKVAALLQDEASRPMLARAVEIIWQEREKRLAGGNGSSEQSHG